MPPDPFDLLSIPARFDLDPAELERRYLAAVSALHPDLASPGDTQAPARSAALNDARAILTDPERRATVLLTRLGGPRPDQEKALPPDFLSEIMEVRQSVEAALASGRPEETERWRTWARQRRREFIGWASAAFAALPQSPDAGVLRDIRRRLNAWRYIERLIEQLEA
jgi:curved DNA-binding protein CbpA